MKIVITSPAGAMHRYTGSFKKAIHYAPLTMTTIAGLLSEIEENDVRIYDETIEKIPSDLEADIVFMTAITGTAPRVYAYADKYRREGKIVILGGVHPTLLPEEAIQHADAVIIGFAEGVIGQLMEDIKRGDIKRFYHGKLNENGSFGPVMRSLIQKGKYITSSSLEASRGCSNECTFCAVNALHSKNVYKRPIPEIVSEIEKIGTKTILFIDVNLIAHRDFAIKLFKALIPLKKWWFGLTTADVVNDRELFDLLVKSGCKGLLIGFESVATSSLGAMNKYRNENVDYFEMMKKMHDAGIMINGTFCFGSDEDNPDIFDRTVEMVEKLKIDLPRYSVLTPFPKTPLYAQLEAENRIFDRHWAMYDVEHVVFEPKNMTVKQLNDGLIRAWRDTYTLNHIKNRILRPHLGIPLSIMTNLAYRHYADKLEEFTREKMIDISDIE
ncbi:B12-binding domain-containing radical SAM protein [Microaceticoccus formicicus]|uniref:B12-binding domain-containing radical SAM protein n=1 Tax=Microaceticoccus formicicus TaxID=3118105 RepID=UPI003CD03126|nr:radical SAM protein [Peptoniphilaceae bacterium AMB_02]